MTDADEHRGHAHSNDHDHDCDCAATPGEYVDLGSLRPAPTFLARPSAVVTLGDLDAVTRELLATAREADTEERAAAYSTAAHQYEMALKERLGLDYRD